MSSMPASCLKIQEITRVMHGAEQRVADYILEHTNEIIRLSITDLAEKSQTSEATVVRMCRKLGYRGFQDLKITLALELVPPLDNIHLELNPADDCDAIIAKVFGSNIQALELTRTVLDPRELEKAAQAVIAANAVEVYGVGLSGPIAVDAYYKIMRINIPSRAFTDDHLQCMSAALRQKGDVVIAISHSGATKGIVDAVRIAKERGATIIAITTKGKSPLATLADIKLVHAANKTEFMIESTTSRLAQMCVVDALSARVAMIDTNRAIDSLKRANASVLGKQY